MIVFERAGIVTKKFKRSRTVLRETSLAIPTDRHIALICPSDEDSQIMINVLGGIYMPTCGRIVRKTRISFPVGHIGGYEAKLSVRQNIEHLARLYDANASAVVDFVESVVHLGRAMDEPYGRLPILMRNRLSRVVAYSLPFDMYILTDGNIGGKARYEDISFALFEARACAAGMIIPMRHPKIARHFCDMGLVLSNGQLRLYDDIETALAAAPNM